MCRCPGSPPFSPSLPSPWQPQRPHQSTLGLHSTEKHICLRMAGKELHNPSTTTALANPPSELPFLLCFSFLEQLAPKFSLFLNFLLWRIPNIHKNQIEYYHELHIPATRFNDYPLTANLVSFIPPFTLPLYHLEANFLITFYPLQFCHVAQIYKELIITHNTTVTSKKNNNPLVISSIQYSNWHLSHKMPSLYQDANKTHASRLVNVLLLIYWSPSIFSCNQFLSKKLDRLFCSPNTLVLLIASPWCSLTSPASSVLL